MNVLIVHSHPEPDSFNAAMTRRAVETFNRLGHHPVVSDLYAMGFDPVSDRRNFTKVADPAYLKMQAEEQHASAHGGFEPALAAEMGKLLAADVLILQFPIWWLSLPAILKGWIDRVFACGVVYGGGRYFEGGVLAGKRAFCSLTVGGPQDVYSSEGLYTEVEDILFPVHRGTFGFTGMTVLEPFVVYGPNRMDAPAREAELERYARHLERLDEARVLPVRTARYEA